MATYKRRKFSNQGKRAGPALENKHTDPAPIRARAPLIEQFYVAVDRQLKSGFETYEAAEKAAQEIKKRYPGPHVTVFDAKEHRHTTIEQPIASTKRPGWASRLLTAVFPAAVSRERNVERRVVALGRRNHLPLLVLRRSSSAIVRQPRSFLFNRKLPAFTAPHLQFALSQNRNPAIWVRVFIKNAGEKATVPRYHFVIHASDHIRYRLGDGQRSRSRHGRYDKHQKQTHKTGRQKSKTDDKAYNTALKSLPDKPKPDPWQGARWTHGRTPQSRMQVAVAIAAQH
jgi:hypothetical protein